MSSEVIPIEQDKKNIQVKYQGGSPDSVYGLGLIGAWVYYIGRATTPKERVQGFFKGLVWPAFLVYELLMFLSRDGSD